MSQHRSHPVPSFDSLLTVAQVAAALQLPRSTVYTHVWSGALPVVNLAPGRGRVLRVRESDLRAFIEARRSAAP